jgi:integrase
MSDKINFAEYPPTLPFNTPLKATPDIYYQDETKVRIPSDDFVISRDTKGNILSRYGDLTYDLAPYSSTKNSKTKIPFDSIEGSSYQYEARWLWFICYRFSKGKNNNNLSVGVLYARFTGFIKPLCQFAKLNNVPAIQALKTKKLLTKFIYKNDTAMFNKQVLPTLKLYHYLKDIIGFDVALTNSVFDALEKRNSVVTSNKKQTELIPPRLYGLWLNEAWSIVEEFEQVSKGISNLLNQLVIEPPPHKTNYSPVMRKQAWEKWIEKYGLCTLASSKGFATDRRKFFFYLSDFALICKGLIHFYSGMRDDEVLSLNYNCLELDKLHKRKRARLIGNTTKYIGNKKQEQWVTTEDLERVISVLQTIAKPIASLIDVTIEPKIKKGQTPCPLFLSINYLISKAYQKKFPQGKVRNWKSTPLSNSLSVNSLFNKDLMKITEEDIKYLEQFDPERNWRQSKYSIGKIWHLKTHQFRRSLAVYSAQSGLVSIGSLQAQLKHLCQEVTFYYGNGAERAGSIFDIESNNHMAHEFLREKPLADYTAWVWQILFSDEKLDGINGRVIERTIKANTSEAKVLIYQDRKKTIKQFKDGQRAYTETPLGGCETTTPCDKKLMHSITACIDCTKADLKPSKVSRTIDSMTIFVNSLTPDSVEYRTEQSELDQLIKLQERMERNNAT